MNGVVSLFGPRSFSFEHGSGTTNPRVSEKNFQGYVRNNDRLSYSNVARITPQQLLSFPLPEIDLSNVVIDNTDTALIVSNVGQRSVDVNSTRPFISVGKESIVHISLSDLSNSNGVVLSLRSRVSEDRIELAFEATDAGFVLKLGDWTAEPVTHAGLIHVGLMLFSAYFTMIRKRALVERENSSKRKGESTQATRCDRDANDGFFNIIHNLDCNLPEPLTGLVTRDGRLDVQVFCFGKGVEVSVNALECCVDHDIGMWCSENTWDAIAADEAVLACFTAAILDQALAKLDPLCGVFSVGYAQIFAFAALFPVIALLLPFAQLGHDSDLFGWRGKNKDSCLCGGEVPTRLCNKPCVDACAKAGKKARCTKKCRMNCVYDPTTNQSTGRVLFNPDRSLPCCPDVTEQCLPWQPLKKACPDRPCYNCKYYCDACTEYHWRHCPNPGEGAWRLEYTTSYPCCKGTPGAKRSGPCTVDTGVNDKNPYSEEFDGRPQLL